MDELADAERDDIRAFINNEDSSYPDLFGPVRLLGCHRT